jgi:hypothetical protein
MVESTDSRVNRNFILQQGLDPPAPGSCGQVASAHLFQPRIVGTVVLIGALLQSPGLFLVLSVVLWWNALLPRWNPFDAIYNATLGAREGASRLGRAPAPRRFSQGMAGTFALIVAILLLAEAYVAARVFEVIFLVAAAAIALGRFCLGSFIYYLLTGQGRFAVRTLPWGRQEQE